MILLQGQARPIGGYFSTVGFDQPQHQLSTVLLNRISIQTDIGKTYTILHRKILTAALIASPDYNIAIRSLVLTGLSVEYHYMYCVNMYLCSETEGFRNKNECRKDIKEQTLEWNGTEVQLL